MNSAARANAPKVDEATVTEAWETYTALMREEVALTKKRMAAYERFKSLYLDWIAA